MDDSPREQESRTRSAFAPAIPPSGHRRDRSLEANSPRPKGAAFRLPARRNLALLVPTSAACGGGSAWQSSCGQQHRITNQQQYQRKHSRPEIPPTIIAHRLAKQVTGEYAPTIDSDGRLQKQKANDRRRV